MNSLLLIAQIILSTCLIALVLMQHGKGADAGAAFGSGSSSTVFGAKGSANFLSKTTAIMATLFFIVCMALAYTGSHRNTADITQSVTEIGTEEFLKDTSENNDLPPADLSNDVSSAADLPPTE